MEEPPSHRIIYDLGGYDWREEEIALLIHSQKRVLHTHTCLGLDIDPSLASALRDRERQNPSEEHRQQFTGEDFFDVLSTKHRLFPVEDTNGVLWWLGLGCYELDACLNQLFLEPNQMEFVTICAAGGIETGSIAAERLELYLQANHELFAVTDRAGKRFWHCLLQAKHIAHAQSLVVRTKIGGLLEQLGCIKRDDAAYKLPSRRGYAQEFVHTTALFQNELVVNRVAQWTARAFRTILPRGEPAVLISATAPAALFARAVAETCWDSPISLHDLGHYFALDEDSVLSANEWRMKAIVITDIMDTGATIAKITRLLRARGFTTACIVALVRFIDPGRTEGADQRTLFWDEWSDRETGASYPLFCITTRQQPVQVSEGLAKERYQDDKRFLVEPYSLEPFSYSSLRATPGSLTPKDAKNCGRLLLLEECGALRAGHWVYGSHHFIVTTSVAHFLRRDEVGGLIAGEIIGICDKERIDHIVAPFNSHIGDLLPRVLAGVKVVTGRHIGCTFAVQTKALAERDFYILPQAVEHLIKKAAKAVLRGKEGIRLLIVDDAVATGRTLETLLRAAIRAACKAVTHYGLRKSPIAYIRAYAVLDRQGRAKGTLWTGIRRISLQGDDEWTAPFGDPDIEFRFSRWLDSDMPVSERESCALCQEWNDLQAMKDKCGLPKDHTVIRAINDRIEAVRPRSTETPRFLLYKGLDLPQPVALGRFARVRSAELALWEFYNLLHRGCPLEYLADVFHSVSRAAVDHPDTSRGVQYLLEEISRAIFQRWKRLRTQWVANEWMAAVKVPVSRGDVSTRWILAEAGRAIAQSEPSDSDLEGLFSHAVWTLAQMDDLTDPFGTKRSVLADGCALCIIAQRFFAERSAALAPSADLGGVIAAALNSVTLKQSAAVLVQGLLHIARRVGCEEQFLPALITVCDHSLRYVRHSHAHLLPFGIEQLALSRPLAVATRRACRDSLCEFIHCLGILNDRYPALFLPKAKQLLPGLITRLSQLAAAIDDDMQTDATKERCKWLADRVRLQFPNQQVNWIYRSLRRTHVRLSELVSASQVECEQRGYSFSVHVGIGITIGNVVVIVPDSTVIQEVILNFTARVPVDRHFCTAPRILLCVERVTELSRFNTSKIALSLYSNLRCAEDAERDLPAGPGMAEFGKRHFAMFGVMCRQPEFRVRGLDDREYSSRVVIEFVSGFQVLED